MRNCFEQITVPFPVVSLLAVPQLKLGFLGFSAFAPRRNAANEEPEHTVKSVYLGKSKALVLDAIRQNSYANLVHIMGHIGGDSHFLAALRAGKLD